MKTRLIVAALFVAAAGFGCQRTYEDRSAGYTSDRELDSTARTEAAQLEYGEEGQQSDVNLTQDMATEESEEAFGGSGTAGMEQDELGYGGGGDAGTGMMMMGGRDAGTGMMMMGSDAGMMGTDAGMMKKATKK